MSEYDYFYERVCPNCTYFANVDLNSRYASTGYVNRPLMSAIAYLKGSELAPDISGFVHFFDVTDGVMVYVDVKGLPKFQPQKGEKMQVGPHGFHIHDIPSCKPIDGSDPFKGAGGHWNPDNQPHGNHAGDFPVLFSNNGIARMCFFTDRFKVKDIIGKTVIIHESPDDYRTQPAGNSGKRIACGIIENNQ